MAQLKTWHTYWCLLWQTSSHHRCKQHAQKPIGRYFQVILSGSSWSKSTLCIFKEQIWLPNRKWCGKNKLSFDQEEMLEMAWYSMHIGFWMCQFHRHRFWGCTFRCFWVMGYMHALSWILLIIGILLEYFEILLKRLHLKKIVTKCSIFLQLLYFYIWEGQGEFLRIRIKFYWGRAKGKGKRGYGGKGPKWGFFLQKFPLLSRIQTLSHKLLVRQTSNHHHCNQHAQKPISRDFQVILSSLSSSKTTLCIFKEQIWLPNRKCYGKLWNVINSFCHCCWSPNI